MNKKPSRIASGLVGMVLLAIAMVWMTAATAKADLIVTFDSVAASGSNFLWTYNVELGPSQETTEGAAGHPTFFTLYDLNGLIAGSETQPSGSWTPTEQLTGITPVGTAPVDSPSVLNITWSYSGKLIKDAKGKTTNLGDFTFLSSFGGVSGLIAFSQQATKNNPGKKDDDTRLAGIGEIVGPAVSTVPEPSSLLLLGSGLLGLAIFTKRKLLGF